MVRKLAHLLRALFQKTRMEQELDEELRFHLEREIEQNIARGMTAEEARLAALRRLGGVTQIKEQCREASGLHFFETIWQDLRYSARMLFKNRGFTAAAALSLALGIGATTAIFSAVNAVLLRPLPFTRQDQLVVAWKRDAAADNPFVELSIPEFVDWRNQNQSFENLAAMPTTVYGYGYTVTGRGEPFPIESARVSASFFPTLGVKAFVGRVFIAEEDRPGAEHVVVLNHRFWQTYFNADPNLVGQQLTLSGLNYTVVGVMPPEFDFPKGVEVWTPLMTNQRQSEDRGAVFLQAIGRLKPGVTQQQASVELNTIIKRLAAQYPETNANAQSVVIAPLTHHIFGNARLALYLLLAASGLLLMIACANISNLLLARAGARYREIAVRAALGASRGRLVRQFFTESLMLASLGGVMGILLAHWLIALLVQVAPTDVPRVDEIHINAPVLAFTCVVTLLTSLLFGFAPALTASKIDLNEALKEGGAKVAGTHRGGRLRRGLVVAEVALTLVLLVGAGLLFRSFLNLRQVKLGFDPQHVLTAQLSLKGGKYAELRQRMDFYTQLLEHLEAQPGVVAAGGVLIRPLEGAIGWDVPYATEGQSLDEAKRNPVPNYEVVTSHYLSAMGIPLIKGRDFNEQDKEDAAQVVIISQTMAQRIFAPGIDPVGQRIKLEPTDPESHWRTVVGVVGDAHYRELSDIRMDVYEPYLQASAPLNYVVIRTTSDPSSFISTLRHEVAALDSNQAVTGVMTMDQLVSRSLAGPRFNMLLLNFFGILATVLAGIGIYGIVSYAVSERTHEIGIRMALGAKQTDVLRLVIGQTMKLVSIALMIGLASSLILSLVLSSLLYGVSSTDPVTFIMIPLLLSGVSIVACFIPALRAAKIDPMVALRYE